MRTDATLIAQRCARGLAQLPYLRRVLALIWTAAPGCAMAGLGLLAMQALLPVATVYLTRAVVDALVDIAAHSGTSRDAATLLSEPIVLWGALLLGVSLVSEGAQGVTGWIRTAQAQRVHDHIRALIHQQSMRVDLAFYDAPDSHDRLHQARHDAAGRPLALIDHFGMLMQHGLTLTAMGAVLAPFGLWLPIALLAGAAPASVAVIRASIRQHQWWLRATAMERRAWYYDWLLTASDAAAELRLFGLGPTLQAAYQRLRRTLRLERERLAKQQSRAEVIAGALATAIAAAAYGSVIWQTRQGLWTLGDVALFHQAFHQGQRLMRGLLENLGRIYTHLLFLESLFDFLALEPRVRDAAAPATVPDALRQGIRFRQVAFRYPGSRDFALRDFNLDINAGQIVAIVGANGAGKSTLLKLLCRLYDPEAGRIELDGVDLRHYPLDELRRMMTVLFQHPVRYHATVAENIGLSRPSETSAPPDPDSIIAAARAASAEAMIEQLPQGYDTPLGRWFNEGTELSGGQWQRLALARACWRQAPIVLLDEPTSAMDPWSEAAWMARFRAYAAGRTAVLITHRITTAMRADIIHVMRHGRIVESGCHRDLSARSDFYRQAWAAQVERVHHVGMAS